MSRFALVALALCVLARPALADEQEDLENDIRQLQLEDGKQAAPPSAEDLQKLGKQILATMAELRQLPIKHPVTMEVATREQIVSYVDSRLAEEMHADELLGQEAALKRLGLVPEAMDMRHFLLDLYGEQVAGYYDPFKQKFFIASWMAPALQAPIMAHELTHALQDQSFNLKPFLTPLQDNSDATTARQAIVEGDAVIAMFAYIGKQAGQDITPPSVGAMIRQSMGSSAYPVFQGAPPYFQEALFFPYADGADFIQLVKKRGGWKQVSALYGSLPRSTEQVLHPEKYFAEKRDEPKAVDLAMKLPGWKEVHTDVLGELVVRTLLRGYLDDAAANAAASGWGGDRYRAFQREKGLKKGARGTMVVLRSTWDTEADAKEFAAAYRTLLPKKYEGAKIKDDKAGSTCMTVEDGFARIEIRGLDVLVIDGAPDAETLEKAAGAGWKK